MVAVVVQHNRRSRSAVDIQRSIESGAAVAVGGAVQGVTQVSVYLCLYNIYILWKLSIRYMGVVISSSFDCCIVFICVYMMIL